VPDPAPSEGQGKRGELLIHEDRLYSVSRECGRRAPVGVGRHETQIPAADVRVACDGILDFEDRRMPSDRPRTESVDAVVEHRRSRRRRSALREPVAECWCRQSEPGCGSVPVCGLWAPLACANCVGSRLPSRALHQVALRPAGPVFTGAAPGGEGFSAGWEGSTADTFLGISRHQSAVRGRAVYAG
jgi:hypothetical protein